MCEWVLAPSLWTVDRRQTSCVPVWENFRTCYGLLSHMLPYELFHRVIELEKSRENVSFNSHFSQPGQVNKVKRSKIIKGRVRMGTEVSWLPFSQSSPFNSSWEIFFSFQVWNCLIQSGWSLKEVLLVHVLEAATKITSGISFSLHIPPTLPPMLIPFSSFCL